MSPELLESQLATLEYLGDDEPGLTIDVGMPAAEIARRIAAR
jgi:gluconate kinase